MKKFSTYDKESTKGHAVFMYSSSEERLALIAEYFRQGIANNELCVFVTPEPQDEVIENFRAVGVDISQAVNNCSLRIFAMNQTYLPDGHFAANFMLQNVSNFMDDAKSEGYNGLRTAGEMSWLSEHPEFTEEARTYEQNVNSLNEPDPNFTGLCLYPIRTGLTEALQGATHTHPTFIYNNQVNFNPQYMPV